MIVPSRLAPKPPTRPVSSARINGGDRKGPCCSGGPRQLAAPGLPIDVSVRQIAHRTAESVDKEYRKCVFTQDVTMRHAIPVCNRLTAIPSSARVLPGERFVRPQGEPSHVRFVSFDGAHTARQCPVGQRRGIEPCTLWGEVLPASYACERKLNDELMSPNKPKIPR